MPLSKLEQISVRAQTWIGAYLVRQFCLSAGINDPRISHFCTYLEELAQCTDVPAWDEKAYSLEVTGLSRLPEDLQHIAHLPDVLESAHEVSASQIYGAWTAQECTAYLRNAARIAGVEIERPEFLSVFAEHAPLIHGWGEPVSAGLLGKWQSATTVQA